MLPLLLVLAKATIPHTIYQTYHTPSDVPLYVADQWDMYASGWTRHVLDDRACAALLTNKFSVSYASVFYRFKGAHRADLCRYALMYWYGGVYADIKFKVLVPLAEIVRMMGNKPVATVMSSYCQNIFQGFILAKPRQPVFLDLMKHMHRTIMSGKAYEYLEFTKYFFTRIKAEEHHLFYEHCAWADRQYLLYGTKPSIHGLTGLNRYCGVCAIVADPRQNITSRALAKVRYDDYPWGRPKPYCKFSVLKEMAFGKSAVNCPPEIPYN